jgi:hypothetical protein
MKLTRKIFEVWRFQVFFPNITRTPIGVRHVTGIPVSLQCQLTVDMGSYQVLGRSPNCPRYMETKWPRGLKRGSAEALFLRLWVRIPRGVWMFVSWERCVLSSRNLCDGLIIRPEESYRVWCVWVWSRSTVSGGLDTESGRSATGKKYWSNVHRRVNNSAPNTSLSGCVIPCFIISIPLCFLTTVMIIKYLTQLTLCFLTLNLPTTTIVAQTFLMFCWPCIIVT